MLETFDRALTLVLKHEGGFVNHPKDPGGATNRGITLATYAAWRGHKTTPEEGSKAHEELLHGLKSISPAEVGAIYRTKYWDVIRGDDLPAGLDYAVFDLAVNSGPFRAATMLQVVLQGLGRRISADGKIGSATIDAAKAVDPMVAIDHLCRDRLAFLRRLPTWPTFGKGWERRVIECQLHAEEMVRTSRKVQHDVKTAEVDPYDTFASTPFPAQPSLWAQIIATLANIFRG